MQQHQDFVSKICQSFSLPLYALVHDSLVQALRSADADQQTSMSIIDSVPKITLKENEYEQLKNAKGKLELQDSFGSGSFYLVDGGKQQAFVFTEQKSADFLQQLSGKQNGQGTANKKEAQGQDQKQTQADGKEDGQSQRQAHSQAQGQSQQQQGQSNLQNVQQQAANKHQQDQSQNQAQSDGQDMQQLELLNLLQKQPADKILQQLALLQLMQGNNNANNLVNDYQKLMLLRQISQASQKQEQTSNGFGQGNSKQTQSQQQGDILNLLEQMQMLNSLQSKQH